MKIGSHRVSIDPTPEPSPDGALNFAEAVHILKDGHGNPEELPKARAAFQAMMGQWPGVGVETQVRLKMHELDHLKRNRALVLRESIDAIKIKRNFKSYEKAAKIALMEEHAHEACSQLKKEKLSQLANAIRSQDHYTPTFDRLVGILNQVSQMFQIKRPITDTELVFRRKKAQENSLDLLTTLCKGAGPESDPLLYDSLYQNLKASAEEFQMPCAFSEADYQSRRRPMVEAKKARLIPLLRSEETSRSHFESHLQQLEMLLSDHEEGIKEYQALISEGEVHLRRMALDIKEAFEPSYGMETVRFSIPSWDLSSSLKRGLFAISLGKQLVEQMSLRHLTPCELDRFYELFCKLPRPTQVFCGYEENHYLSSRKFLAQVFVDKTLGSLEPSGSHPHDLRQRGSAVLREIRRYQDLELPNGWTKNQLEKLAHFPYYPL